MNAMLWRMLSRLETCIVYCCIWSVALAKSIVPRKTWRKLWHSYISKLFFTKMQFKFISFMFKSVNLSILQKTINKTSKSPHAFSMCSIRTDLLKQENEKIALAKSIVPRKTWRKLWHSYISKLFLTKMQVKFSIFFHHRE
jgi:hypothetical protein